ncbi:MAG: amino acid adenylation domain-containing protein [Candidatus Promineifilaceae bacterium]
MSPDSISYIEAHGTATPLGDPIEFAGLSRAFAGRSQSADKIVIGTVKGNIGHLDAAAGIAGVIKTALSLQNETIPPTLHYKQPNKEIDFENSPFYVTNKLTNWPQNRKNPRRAGVSSFGVGGTNAHLVMEETPELRPTSLSRPRQLLLLSAKSASALDKQSENLANWLEQNPNVDLADVAYTLVVGRAEHKHRRVIAVGDVSEAIERLRSKNAGVRTELKSAEPEIVFMFPGQGAQFVGMGRELYQNEPVFTNALDQCADILQPYLGLDMRSILYPENSDDPEAAHQLKQTGLAQPAIFMVSYAQAMLWQSWGIAPDLMVGHSVGEFAAATLAGIFSLQDALKIIAGRARLMQDLPGGSMRAVRMSEAELKPWLDKFTGVSLAAVNGPAVCIVSGPTEMIAQFDQALEAADHETIQLHTSHAFHSSMMDEILAPFGALVNSVERNAPNIPMVSTLTGADLGSEEAKTSDYWTRQLRQAVLFSPAAQQLLKEPNRVFLEVGPGTNLSSSMRQHLSKSDPSHFIVDSLGHASKQLPALEATLEGLGKLWMFGAEPKFDKYYAAEQRRRVSLPTYPFERQRYWIDPPAVNLNEATFAENIPQVLSPAVSTNAPQAMTASLNAAPEQMNVALSNGQMKIENKTSQNESETGRNANIKNTLVALLYDISGIEINESDYDTSFAEMGFDSLTLTQVSTALRKQMKVSIRFRKLLEDVATINELTAFCASNLPDAAYAPAQPQTMQPEPAAPSQPEVAQPQVNPPPLNAPLPQMNMPQMVIPPNPSGMMNNSMQVQMMQMQMMQMQQMMLLMQQQLMMMGQGQVAQPETTQATTGGVQSTPAAADSGLQEQDIVPTKSSDETPFSLTEAQKEIWLASQMNQKAATAYNQGFRIHLKGDINQEALVQAMQRVIGRHEALHSRFEEDGSTQKPASDRNIDVIRLDFTKAPSSQQALDNHLDSLMLEPFNLKDGPLVRPYIVKIGPQEYVMVWVAAHIIFDGWSVATVINEIRSFYNEASGGDATDFTDASSFRDYVMWEQERSNGKHGEETLGYWNGRFSTLPPLLNLPGDFPRPAKRSYGASSVHYEFSGDVINGINQLAKTWRTSTFVVMLAAYKTMLYRLSGNEDLVVGIHTSGQLQTGLNNLVSHAINTLPIRSNPVAEISFAEYAAQVKDSFLDAQDHQPFTFGQLLQSLNIPRDPSRAPLVEAAFNLDRKAPEGEFLGLSQTLIELPKKGITWDLFLSMYEEDGTLKADFSFNSDLFSEATVLGWLENLSIMLDGIVANPDERLSQLDFFADNGLSDDLGVWNQTETTYPSDLTLPEILSQQAQRVPSKPAIADKDKVLTYHEVDQRMNLLARYFQRRGVSPGTLVGLCVDRSTDMVVAALAILHVGATYVPLDPDYPADRLNYMIEDSEMPFVVTQSSRVAQMPSSVQLIILDEEAASIALEPTEPIVCLAQPSNAAYMIYTSGSTGRPKGVMVPHQALINFLHSMQSKPGMSAEDTLVSVTTLSFDIAGLELYLPLISGAQVVVTDPEVSRDGPLLAALLKDVGATIMQATPATWKLLLDSGWKGQPGLKMLCGGEPMSRQLANDLLARGGSELWNMYGPTETTIWSTISPVFAGDDVIAIGRPIANTQIYILNQQMRPVPVGTEGDLYIGGHGLALGYHKRPDLTAERFIPNPFGDGRIYQTGDIAKFEADGTIICLGRADNQVKIRGYRIELGEIESVLLQEATATDVAVIVREDEPDDKRIVAYIVQSNDGLAKTDSIAILRDAAVAKLPQYMVPSAWVMIDKFPLTPNGKIDRLSFPAPETSREDVGSPYTAPETETEKHLVQIWADILKVEPSSIGSKDDFFELGGHSLLATRVISRIRQQLDVRLPLLAFFEGATIAALSEKIEMADGGVNKPVAKNGASVQSELVLPSNDLDQEEDDLEEFVI